MWKLKTALLAWALATWLNTQAQAQDLIPSALASENSITIQDKVKSNCLNTLLCSLPNETDAMKNWRAFISKNPEYTRLYEEYLEQLYAPKWPIEHMKTMVIKGESWLAQAQESWNKKKISKKFKRLNKSKRLLSEYENSPNMLLWLPEMRIVDTMNLFAAIWNTDRAAWKKTWVIEHFSLLSKNWWRTEDEKLTIRAFRLTAKDMSPEIALAMQTIFDRDLKISEERLAESEKNLKFALLFKDL